MLKRAPSALLALAVITALGCAAEDPPQNDPHDAATTEAAVLSPECASCVDAQCGIPRRACLADETCSELMDCWTGATSATEGDACLTGYGDAGASRAALDSLAQCASRACGTQCPPPPRAAAEIAACQEQAHPDLSPLPDAVRSCACERCAPDLIFCATRDYCVSTIECVAQTGCAGDNSYADCSEACADALDGTIWPGSLLLTLQCLDVCTQAGDIPP